MIKVIEVIDGIYTFQSPVPGVNRTLTSYVIRESPAVLIDPGPSTAIPFLQEALNQLGIKELSYIIPTHIHVDHAGASGDLAKLYPASKVLMHPSAVKHMVEPTRLIESTRMVFGQDFEKAWGGFTPMLESQIKVPQDGEEIDLGSRKLKIVYSPGHAPHHLAILDEQTMAIFSGEALGVPRPGAENFPLPAVVPPSHDNEVFLGTIQKLEALKPQLICYGHDGVGRDPDKLIPVVYENTRVFGEIVLKALKEGVDSKEVGRRVQQYITEKTGIKSEFSDRTMTVIAYSQYFKRKGMI